MRGFRRRLGPPAATLVVAVSTLLLSTAVSGASPAMAHVATHVVSVTGRAAASEHDDLLVLAGSTSHAVYLTERAVTVPDYTGATPPQLAARDRSGATVHLGVLPTGLTADPFFFTTAGRWVVAFRDAGQRRTIDVWNIGTRRHRVVHLPASARMVAATSSGFVYAHGGSLREWAASSGRYRSLGVPFPGQDIGSLVTDDRDLVVTGRSSGAKVMSLARPGSYRKLDVGKHARCYAVDHSGAACAITNDETLAFLPLDGSAATPSPAGFVVRATSVAIAGKEVLFVNDGPDTTNLYGFRAGDPTVVTSSRLVGEQLISAYGKVLMTPNLFLDQARTVLAATSPQDITDAFTIPRSTETAGSFALTPHRLVYISDRRNPSDPKQGLGVRSIDLRDTKGRIVTTPSRAIAGRDNDLQVETSFGDPEVVLAATATTTVFTRTSQQIYPDVRVYVKTPSRTVELPGALDLNDLVVEVAGHRVLWTTDPYAVPETQLKIYNTRTGTIRTLSGVKSQGAAAFALTPSHLAYATKLGVVRWLDLATGVTTTVYSPTKQRQSFVAVFAKSGWVAWDIAPVSHPFASVDGMRHVQPHGPIVTLSHRVYGISDAGVLLKATHYRSTLGFRRKYPLYTTWLRPFHGPVRTLLSTRAFEELPQLAGHVMSWVSGMGDLKVTRYPV